MRYNPKTKIYDEQYRKLSFKFSNRLGNTDNRYDNTNVVARAVAQCNYPTITLPRASKRENCDNRQNAYESNPNEALRRYVE